MTAFLPDVRQPWELEVGWFDTVARPRLEQATADELAAAWTALVDQDVLLERHDRASAEWRKAVRYAERRLGELLGSSRSGPRPDVPEVCRNLDSHQRAAFRRMAAVDHDRFVERLAVAEVPTDLGRAAVARWSERTAKADEEAAARRAVFDAAVADAEGDGWKLLHGDFRERLAEVPDGSVDVIVTDPPYPAEFLPLWSDLAEVAARVLRPQGLLLAMSGKVQLLEVTDGLRKHLRYGWVYVQPLTSSNSRVLARQVLQAWKPWLAFSNGAWPSGRVEWHADLLAEGVRVKDTYRWQQDHGPVEQLLVDLTRPNDLVLDPFVGTGTTGVAALRTGRRFLGVELDADRFSGAVDRLKAVTPCTS